MRWLFDDHVLDVERRELRRAGALVAIEPQVFDLLVHLIRNRTRVVSKDDLLDAIWEGRIVSDSALANRINAARAAVGDNGEDQRVIRTLPRKGFRFVGSVAEETAEPVVASPRTNTAPQLVLPEQPSLVVLPFTDMSPDRNEGHFADGITEDLITELARIRWLFVIARNSAFTYKDRPVDVKQISRELGIRYVLEGSVRRSGQRMRINAQLVDATSGVHQWAERYDRDVGEIFAVQEGRPRMPAALTIVRQRLIWKLLLDEEGATVAPVGPLLLPAGEQQEGYSQLPEPPGELAIEHHGISPCCY